MICEYGMSLSLINKRGLVLNGYDLVKLNVEATQQLGLALQAIDRLFTKIHDLQKKYPWGLPLIVYDIHATLPFAAACIKQWLQGEEKGLFSPDENEYQHRIQTARNVLAAEIRCDRIFTRITASKVPPKSE